MKSRVKGKVPQPRIVVMGASLGGTEALRTVLSALPTDCPFPVVVVLHRHRDSGQVLAEHLHKSCAVPVVEAEDKMPVEPGRVYLAPPDYHLLVERELGTRNSERGRRNEECGMMSAEYVMNEASSDVPSGSSFFTPSSEFRAPRSESFALSTDEEVNYARPSIDVLFESAAEVYGKAAVGVILTGTGEDGARGLARMRELGGLTVAQNPETARAPDMPTSAIDAKGVDFILPLEQIGPFLVDLGSAERGARNAERGREVSRKGAKTQRKIL